MPSLDHIKRVVERIASVDEIREHIYFFGGAIPYIYYGEESGRDHTDIDILVDESHIDIIRDILKDHNTMVTRTRQYDKEHNLTSLYREKMTQIYPGDFQRHKQYTLYDFKNKKYDDLYMGYFRNGQQEYLKESGELIAVDSKAAKSANNVISGHKIKITHSEKHGI